LGGVGGLALFGAGGLEAQNLVMGAEEGEGEAVAGEPPGGHDDLLDQKDLDGADGPVVLLVGFCEFLEVAIVFDGDDGVLGGEPVFEGIQANGGLAFGGLGAGGSRLHDGAWSVGHGVRMGGSGWQERKKVPVRGCDRVSEGGGWNRAGWGPTGERIKLAWGGVPLVWSCQQGGVSRPIDGKPTYHSR
jgi:hypothetical protein